MTAEDILGFLNKLSTQGIIFYRSDDKPVSNNEPDIEINQFFYQPHKHDQLEMICPLEGKPAIGLNGRWTIAEDGRIQVFIPGAVHGEHYSSPEESYKLLWATVFPQALFLHLTSYSLLNGYSTSMKRLALTSPMCQNLWETSRDKKFSKSKMLQARFHYLLMECLYYYLANPATHAAETESYHEQVVEQVKKYIDNYYWEDMSLEKLADIVHYSPGHLNSIFRQHLKVPLHKYLNEVRLRKAYELLISGKMLVKQAAEAVGFSDPLYFSRKFKERFKKSPRDLFKH
jgi:AraC-like DNA-binding protein